MIAADDLASLVRGAAGRNPENAIEIQRRAQCIRDVKVAIVNRVEGSTEDADAPRLLSVSSQCAGGGLGRDGRLREE